MSFELHPRLHADTVFVGELPLSRLLLMNDARYPWAILVPRRDNLREIYELSGDDQSQLLLESSALARALMNAFSGHKLNIGALGNVVAQLHVHHVVRYPDDPAWPGPVWGHSPAQAYTPETLQARIAALQLALELPLAR